MFLFSDLVSPLVDDRHVDIIYKNGHFLPGRGSISCPHPLIHIALNCPLKKKQGEHMVRLKRCNNEGDRKREDKSSKTLLDIIHHDSLINGSIATDRKKTAVLPSASTLLTRPDYDQYYFTSL